MISCIPRSIQRPCPYMLILLKIWKELQNVAQIFYNIQLSLRIVLPPLRCGVLACHGYCPAYPLGVLSHPLRLKCPK